jgi:hypothetical protein
MADCIRQAKNFVARHAPGGLGRCLGVAAALQLFPERPVSDIHVHVDVKWRTVSSFQCAPAVVVALLSAILRRRPKTGVVILGRMTESGELYPGLDADHEPRTVATVDACRTQGIERIIVGAETELSPDVREAAQERGVEIVEKSTVMEALPLLF